MLDCVITGISQDMDFEQGLTLTYLLVRLPSGEVVKAAVDDTVATAVLSLQAELKGMPRPAIRPTAVRPAPRPQVEPAAPVGEDPETYEEDEPEEPKAALQTFANGAGESVHVFGGQDDTPEEKAAMAEGSPTLVVEEPLPRAPTVAAPARSNLQRTPGGKLIAPSRTVPSRSGGYPDTKNGVDTDELTTTRDRDEDGVGSV